MSSMQDRILKSVEGKLSKAGFEYARSASWANILSIRVFEPGSLVQAFEIHLNFQDSRVSGGIIYEGEKIVNSAPYVNGEMIRERSLYAHYADSLAMTAFSAKIDKAIAEFAPAAPAAASERETVEYTPLGALAEIGQLLDGLGDPEDGDDYVGRALRIARETVAANAAPAPSMS